MGHRYDVPLCTVSNPPGRTKRTKGLCPRGDVGRGQCATALCSVYAEGPEGPPRVITNTGMTVGMVGETGPPHPGLGGPGVAATWHVATKRVIDLETCPPKGGS